MAWFKRKDHSVVERSVSIGDPAVAALFGYTPLGGPTVSESTAMTLSAVFRAVSLVSGAIASLPLRTLEVAQDGTKQRVASFLDNPGGERFTPFEFKQLVAVHLLLHGNAYLQHINNGAGAVIALHPIHPANVTAEWDSDRPGGKVFKVQAVVDGQTKTLEFDATDMTQIMGVSLDGLTGCSAITLARLSLGTGLSGDKAAERMFRNGALISGLVTPSEEDLEEDEAKTIKESINRKMLGTENAGDIAVINRRLTFQPWTLSAVDAQFLESRTFSIDEIGRWFGLPPHLLGLTEKSTSWGQGIHEQNRGLARYTLTPWTSTIDERLTRLLSQNREAEFDFSAFVKPSPEDEINLLIAEVNSGLLTLNEARKIRNMPPLENGDTPRTPAGSNPPKSDEGQEESVTLALDLVRAAPSLMQAPGLPAIVDQIRALLEGEAPPALGDVAVDSEEVPA